jgi:DNA-binding NarL/FixJ family response regulator
MNLTKLDTENVEILLADDHPLLCQALRYALEKQQDFKVIAEASNGEEAVKLATELLPNIVIMDIGMPVLNGIDATKQIKKAVPSIAILALTIHDDNEHIISILEAGASGYLTKSAKDSEVINAIRSIMEGETVLSQTVFQQILKYASKHAIKPVNINTREKLSTRELELLQLIAEGISNKDIALRLDLNLRTIKGYLNTLFSKLGVASRTEAVIVGLRKGIINLQDFE